MVPHERKSRNFIGNFDFRRIGPVYTNRLRADLHDGRFDGIYACSRPAKRRLRGKKGVVEQAPKYPLHGTFGGCPASQAPLDLFTWRAV